MNREFEDFENQHFESLDSQIEDAELQQLIDIAPAVSAARSVLRKANEFDQALLGVDSEHSTRRFKIRSAGNDDYPFVHDKVVLVPKRREQVGVARREMRFSVAEGDHQNSLPSYVIISDYDKDDKQLGELILSNAEFGYINESVTLNIKNDRLLSVDGVEHEPSLDPNFFASYLLSFDLEHQLNDGSSSTEAA